MNKGDSAEKLHAESGENFERSNDNEAEIVMKQVALDVAPGIDMNIANEEWIKPYLNKFAKWKSSHAPQEASKKNNDNTLNSAYLTAFNTPLYSFTGKHVKCILDKGVQLLGKGVPDNNGYVSVVTRDGKSGKVDISRLTKAVRQKAPLATPLNNDKTNNDKPDNDQVEELEI